MSAQDELTATLCLAVRRLTHIKKAEFLLNTALALIEHGQYGKEVETYLDICIRTPGLPKGDMEKALLAQRARKSSAGQLKLSDTQIHFSVEPACERITPEIWEEIATQIPRYHLRKWLSISPLHREIASRQLFHTLDISFLELDLQRGLDILERVINDPIFAGHVRSLRLHWHSYEEGDALESLLRLLKISLPAFKALRDFEWAGYPDMPIELLELLLNTHKRLQGLRFIGGHLDAVGSSTIQNLRKFTFRIDDEAPLQDIRDLLDRNESSLKQLSLGGLEYVDDEDDSWDLVFKSATIENLVHLGLSSPEISGFVLGRITQAANLQSLTLHGSFVEPQFASELFATTRMPHLESFGFVMDDQHGELYEYVTWHFLRKREKLRRLDLGSCPWETAEDILPTLSNLRVLAVCIDELEQIESFVQAIPRQMVAIRLSVDVSDSDEPFDDYVHHFTRFNTLSFLHLQLFPDLVRPKHMSAKDFQMQTDKTLHSIAAAVPSLDFLACFGQLYIVVRSQGDNMTTCELKELPKSSRLEYGSGINAVSEDIAWLQQKLDDEPMEF